MEASSVQMRAQPRTIGALCFYGVWATLPSPAVL